ncbi:MAG: hypothetical protein H0T57_08715 [Rubrobacter sp.]|nr:hypothetical protein [Rubrobacter sp.]MDQ3303263.1 hypothetical protein [Actinomycetota bacterium]
MDTRNQRKPPDQDARPPDEHYREPGLGAWIRRNTWLLVRLFVVMIFTFGASTTAANFSYGLQSDPTVLSVEQLNRGELPSGIELGDYVEVTGTPDFGTNPDTGQPRIGVSARYEVSYYYFRLGETGENLLIQQTSQPDLAESGEQVWRGKIATVGTVIFHDTTQSGLEVAGLPRDESIPVIETGDTPEYYRQIFPAYSAIIGLWILSIAWLVWKRNKPFLGL